MENKKTINILAISGILLLLIAFFSKYKCIFKSVFNIPCISCGLTRGFKFILNGNLIQATKMNLLSVPIFLVVIVFYSLYFVWIIIKKDYVFKFYNYFIKNYKVIIFILIINWVINVVKYLYFI